MASTFYFGTRGYMRDVRAPTINAGASSIRWQSQKALYLSGGAYIRSSVASHKEYDFSWTLAPRAELRKMTDFAMNQFGPPPFYWLDPFAMDVNLLPSYWGSPFIAGYDGPILDGQPLIRPALTPTPGNSYFYPIESAIFTVGAVTTRPSVWVPVAPGYTIWVGAHGAAGTGGVVVATPTSGTVGTGTAVNLTMLPVTSSTRVNQSFDGNTYNGVLISLGGAGTVTLSGIIVQVFATGVTPPLGDFPSGQGHSGCTFENLPTLVEYSSGLDLIGITAKLTEINGWL